jgi:hypothetical protein
MRVREDTKYYAEMEAGLQGAKTGTEGPCFREVQVRLGPDPWIGARSAYVSTGGLEKRAKGRPSRNGPSPYCIAPSAVLRRMADPPLGIRTYRIMLNRCTVLLPFTVMCTM